MTTPNDPIDPNASTAEASAAPERTRRPSAERVRIIGTDDGLQWIVREVSPPVFDRRGTFSLIFTSDHIMRRVRNYPAAWYDLSDAELLELSLSA